MISAISRQKGIIIYMQYNCNSIRSIPEVVLQQQSCQISLNHPALCINYFYHCHFVPRRLLIGLCKREAETDKLECTCVPDNSKPTKATSSTTTKTTSKTTTSTTPPPATTARELRALGGLERSEPLLQALESTHITINCGGGAFGQRVCANVCLKELGPR